MVSDSRLWGKAVGKGVKEKSRWSLPRPVLLGEPGPGSDKTTVPVPKLQPTDPVSIPQCPHL